MKKYIIFFLLLFLVTGCSFSANTNNIEKGTKLYTQSATKENIPEEVSTNEEVSSYININTNYDEWYNKTKENIYIITVLGSSQCGFCQNFKPIIEKVAANNKINLYFYYVDTIDQEEANKLKTAYNSNYTSVVPHMFITKNGNIITNYTGEMTEDELLDFLKLNLIIE